MDDDSCLTKELQPRLIIHCEKHIRRVPATIGFENQTHIGRVRFVVVNGIDDRTLECLSDDLIDFCRRLYASNFTMDCYGEGTTRRLEYKWGMNELIIHDHHSESTIVKVSMDNVDTIKTIAAHNRRDRCIIC